MMKGEVDAENDQLRTYELSVGLLGLFDLQIGVLHSLSLDIISILLNKWQLVCG
jgi:hypothetical protein